MKLCERVVRMVSGQQLGVVFAVVSKYLEPSVRRSGQMETGDRSCSWNGSLAGVKGQNNIFFSSCPINKSNNCFVMHFGKYQCVCVCAFHLSRRVQQRKAFHTPP